MGKAWKTSRKNGGKMREKSVGKMWKKKRGKDVKNSGGKNLEKNVKKMAWKKPWINNDLERWKASKIFVENCYICSCETTWTNHYDGPIRNIKQQLEHIYYTLFCRCIAICQPPQTVQLCWAKTIFLSQIISIFWILFIQFYSAGHILSTAEVPNFTPTLISGRY